MSKPLKIVPLALTALVLTGMASCAPTAGIAQDQGARSGSDVVASVHDGDTPTLRKRGVVRLIGYDTPEVPPRPAQCGGREATEVLRQLAPVGSRVRWRYQAEHQDPYDRQLLDIWTESGAHINLQVVARGYAVPLAIAPNTRYAKQISQAANRARRDRLGLWRLCGRPKP